LSHRLDAAKQFRRGLALRTAAFVGRKERKGAKILTADERRLTLMKSDGAFA
jgi:hypothetical protein